MNKFFENYTFVLAFMIFLVFFNMILGEKPTMWFLTLILGGMLIMNADRVSSLFTKLGG